MPELRNNKDIWAGLLLIAIGMGATAIARNYPFGNALRMGPGYFPVVLGGLLVVFGLTKRFFPDEIIEIGRPIFCTMTIR